MNITLKNFSHMPSSLIALSEKLFSRPIHKAIALLAVAIFGYLALYSFFSFRNNKGKTLKQNPQTPPTLKQTNNHSKNVQSNVPLNSNIYIQAPLQHINEEMENFRNAALKTLSEKKCRESIQECPLSEDERTQLFNMEGPSYFSNQDVNVIQGGENYVFFLKTVPKWVFKPMKDKLKGEEYVKISEEARHIVQEKGLYLLNVPKTTLFEINGKYFIAQEKADIISGDFHVQKGIYNFCWYNKEMKQYISNVFKQLFEFITLSGFSDVKYNNILITKNGEIALVDLDKKSIISGLTHGGGRRHGGFFHYLPLGKIMKFMNLAKEKLCTNEYIKLEKEIDKIKKRVELKTIKQEKHFEFLREQNITSVQQSINKDSIKKIIDKQEKAFAFSLIDDINTKLKNQSNYSLSGGRKIRLCFNTTRELIDNMRKIWGKGLMYWDAQPKLKRVLDHLKKIGCIHEYKIDIDTKITC